MLSLFVVIPPHRDLPSRIAPKLSPTRFFKAGTPSDSTLFFRLIIKYPVVCRRLALMKYTFRGRTSGCEMTYSVARGARLNAGNRRVGACSAASEPDLAWYKHGPYYRAFPARFSAMALRSGRSELLSKYRGFCSTSTFWELSSPSS